MVDILKDLLFQRLKKQLEPMITYRLPKCSESLLTNPLKPGKIFLTLNTRLRNGIYQKDKFFFREIGTDCKIDGPGM